VPQKTVRKFEQLKEIMSITGNFRRVREMLLSTSPPCAPYIGVYLQDMVFIEDGNQTWTDEGLLNFDKISIFGKVLQQIRTFQQTPYRLFPIPFLQDFLTNKLIMLDDNTLEEESFKRELKAMSSPKQNKSK
jgi:son of sevenless-like protein